ncbi:MAG: polyprenyl synthetase family protein [Burkholderiaceae bacterium]|nr:polyprenyl synthetase family protein [Burkholderiaceae bacterium]
MNPFNFEAWVQTHSARAEAALIKNLDVAQTVPQRLHEAMLYASLGGGKRMRPLLVYAAGELGNPRASATSTLADGEHENMLDTAAAAIEMMHAYSLVHDDLPCMDDDDLRRGRPTVHKAFDEATALLVGDALQTRAFEILAKAPGNSEMRLALIAGLASAAGSRGMAGGQAIDLDSVGAKLDLAGLQNMHQMKTGALLTCAVQMGGIVANLSPAEMRALTSFASALGLAFQIVDDVLDATADSQTLGKTAGKDAANDKPTYVTLMGLDYAQGQAQEMHQQALASIDSFGLRADALRGLAAFVVNRRK